MTFAPNCRLGKIGKFCFQNSGLEELQLPQGLLELGDEAFADCRNLSAVRLNEDLKAVSDGCLRNSGLEALTVPASVRKIGCGAFQNCKHLEKLEFAEESQLKQVKKQAFVGTALVRERIDFPPKTHVEKGAF